MLKYSAKKEEIMENITSLVSVQVDIHDKEMANDILKSLGLNMSTYVNMAIKQLLYTNGLPFEVKNPSNTNVVEENQKLLDKIKNKTANNYNEYTAMPNLGEFIK